MLKNEILAKLQDIKGMIEDNPQESIKMLDTVIDSINFNPTFTQKELISIIIKDITNNIENNNKPTIEGILNQLNALHHGLNE